MDRLRKKVARYANDNLIPLIPPTPSPARADWLVAKATIGIPYTSALKLDVYAPTAPGLWPVVVLMHGLGGSQGHLALFARAIAQEGAVVFTPQWREWPASAP